MLGTLYFLYCWAPAHCDGAISKTSFSAFCVVQLLGRTSGFAVAPTHRPCTKGLWMWSQPVKRTAPDGSVYHLVLLDSEGIDAYDQTGTYSVQIFSLAVLLSSMFVYNQVSHAPPTQPAPVATRSEGFE
jgi:hypothetical protein